MKNYWPGYSDVVIDTECPACGAQYRPCNNLRGDGWTRRAHPSRIREAGTGRPRSGWGAILPPELFPRQ